MPYLRITEGAGAGLSVALHGETVSIGRDGQCGLQLLDTSASRQHATCEQRAAEWVLCDLGSSNGTWHQGKRIETLPLAHGCEFRIGNTILRFEVEAIADAHGTQASWGEQVHGLGEDSSLFNLQDTDAPSVNRYLVLLHQFIRHASTTNDRAALFDLLDELAAEALEGDRIAVFLPDGHGWSLWPPHERRLRARFGTTPYAGTLLAIAWQKPEALLCTSEGDVDPSKSMDAAGLRSAMVAPLRIGEEVHGLLYVDRLNTDKAFTRTDLEFLEAVANQMAVRLHNQGTVAQLQAEIDRLSTRSNAPYPQFAGSTASVKEIEGFIQRVAALDTAIALIGESGCGKRSMAQAIHLSGPRSAQPMQTFTCSAYSQEMCAVSLFGRGNDLRRDPRPGLFEQADNSTLYLQDVEHLDADNQRRIISTLRDNVVHRNDEPYPRPINVRLIVSCSPEHQDMPFLRELGALSFTCTALRERSSDDREILTRHLLAEAAERLEKNSAQLSSDLSNAFANYIWPGNVRQLRDAIHHGLIISLNNTITLDDMPESLREQLTNKLQHTELPSLAEVQRLHILRVLEHCGGSKSAAATVLGIDRSTLHTRLRNYGVNK